MSLETIPRTESYEFCHPLVNAPTWSARVASGDLPAHLGRVALRASGIRLYWRTGDRLSTDDIEQLEEFYALLRRYYGIPADQPVFPKRTTPPEIQPAKTETETADAP